MSEKKFIELAAITGAHGISGEVRLKLFGEGVAAFKRFRAFSSPDGDITFTLKKVRDDGKGGAIARFEGVSDRNAAEKLRGTVLTVPRDELPELEETEYYHSDLIGLRVVTDAGEEVGTVQAVANYGATDVIEIEKSPRPEKGHKTFMVPMTKQAVISWDNLQLIISSAYLET